MVRFAQAGAEELDELSDHAVFAQAFGDHQHEICCGGPFGHRAHELESQHWRNQHRHRLSQHRGLRLDASDAPSKHAQPVHHRGVRIGAHKRVGKRAHFAIGDLAEHHPREVLDIHLMHDPGVRRHDAEIPERVLPPPQEGIPLPVSPELELCVQLKRVAAAEVIHLNRVIDDELDGLQRIDAIGIAAEANHAVAHRGKIDDAGDAGEVLEEDTRGRKRNLLLELRAWLPGGERLDVLRLHEARVFVAQQILEKDFQ